MFNRAVLAAQRRFRIEATQSLPAMTSNTAPSGHVVSADAISSGTNDVWRAFDASTTSFWASGTGGSLPHWVQRQAPTAIRVGRIAITNRNDAFPERSTNSFTFAGSNNGTTWQILLTVSGQVGWGSGERRTFDISPQRYGFYSYHRLTVTSVNSTTEAAVVELELLQAS